MRTKILDCTLRDGGYVNNWLFKSKNIEETISGLSEAKIDIIESGFLSSENVFSEDESRFSTLTEAEQYIVNYKKDIMYACMINYGEVPIEKLPQYTDGLIRGLRVVFHKHKMKEAIEYCKLVKEKGYFVFVQPMSTISYTDFEILSMIERVNAFDPYALYLVDTAGMMYKNDLLRLFYLVDNNLNKNVKIGYHAHNNLQLAFSNAQELLSLYTKREIIIDSSLYGMGRGAGNLCTELIVEYINSNYEKRYSIIPIFEVIDNVINPIKELHSWGYSVPYYIGAIHKCHPNYAKFLIDKQTLSIETIDRILKAIPENARYDFKQELVSKLYYDFQCYYVDDSKCKESLKAILKERKVLILAPGHSLTSERNKIEEYIKASKPIVISINFYDNNFPIDYTFVSNNKRIANIKEIFIKESLIEKLIITSNINIEQDLVNKICVINYSTLLNDSTNLSDNAGLMLIKLLTKLGCKEIVLAGFDGYHVNKLKNYYDADLLLKFESDAVDKYNTEMINMINSIFNNNIPKFLTTSLYN